VPPSLAAEGRVVPKEFNDLPPTLGAETLDRAHEVDPGFTTLLDRQEARLLVGLLAALCAYLLTAIAVAATVEASDISLWGAAANGSSGFRIGCPSW
jgi:hypothetical protein